MPEVKPSTAKSDDPRPSAPAKAGLSQASESSDPSVHKLLADIQTARLNDNNDEVKALTKELADLGFE